MTRLAGDQSLVPPFDGLRRRDRKKNVPLFVGLKETDFVVTPCRKVVQAPPVPTLFWMS